MTERHSPAIEMSWRASWRLDDCYPRRGYDRRALPKTLPKTLPITGGMAGAAGACLILTPLFQGSGLSEG